MPQHTRSLWQGSWMRPIDFEVRQHHSPQIQQRLTDLQICLTCNVLLLITRSWLASETMFYQNDVSPTQLFSEHY